MIEVIDKQTKLSWMEMEEMYISGCMHIKIPYLTKFYQFHNYVTYYYSYITTANTQLTSFGDIRPNIGHLSSDYELNWRTLAS